MTDIIFTLAAFTAPDDFATPTEESNHRDSDRDHFAQRLGTWFYEDGDTIGIADCSDNERALAERFGLTPEATLYGIDLTENIHALADDVDPDDFGATTCDEGAFALALFSKREDAEAFVVAATSEPYHHETTFAALREAGVRLDLRTLGVTPEETAALVAEEPVRVVSRLHHVTDVQIRQASRATSFEPAWTSVVGDFPPAIVRRRDLGKIDAPQAA